MTKEERDKEQALAFILGIVIGVVIISCAWGLVSLNPPTTAEIVPSDDVRVYGLWGRQWKDLDVDLPKADMYRFLIKGTVERGDK